MAIINRRMNDEPDESHILSEECGMNMSIDFSHDVQLSELDASLKQLEIGQTTRVNGVASLMDA